MTDRSDAGTPGPPSSNTNGRKHRVGQSVVSVEALSGRPDELDELVETRRDSPGPAILAAHNAVEDVVRSIATGAGISEAGTMSLDKLTPALAEREIITRKTSDALAGLVTLKNLAVHGPEPVARRAREYIVLAEGVLYALSQAPGVREPLSNDKPAA